MKNFRVICIFVVIFAIAIFFIVRELMTNDFLGWRLNLSLRKVETSDYQSFAPKIAFKYPKNFEIDSDPENRYGDSYLAGIKLRTDNRTGCDIRTNGTELDFSKTEDKLINNTISQIKDKASDFRLIQKQKISIGGRPAFKVSFSFLDPIGARVRLDQIFVKNDGTNYLIICGAGEYQFDFFEKDFGVVYKSVVF